MYTPVFDDYQKQFSEWQQQVTTWQKKVMDTWMTALPNMKGEVNFSEGFEKALTFQEELVKSYLETQEQSARSLLDAQRKFWQDYFEQMRKQPNTTAS